MAVWHQEQEWFLTVIRNTIINELDELNSSPKSWFAFSKRRRFVRLDKMLKTLQRVDGSVLFDKATVIASGVSVNPNEVSFSPWLPANPTATFNRTFSLNNASKQAIKQLCQAWVKAILVRDKRHCKINGPRCIGTANTADHIIPVAEGGKDTLANGQAACDPCHASKTQAEATRGRIIRAYEVQPI